MSNDLTGPELANPAMAISEPQRRVLDKVLARAARLAKALANGQAGYVALVEGDRLRFVGDGPERAFRRGSLADQALRKRGVAWVQDASKEPTLAADPLVAGRKDARFCACAPIRVVSGKLIGVVGVMDRRARPYDGGFAEQLKDLAAMVAAAWDGAGSATEPAPEPACEDVSQTLLSFVADAPVGMVMTDRDLRILQCSQVWLESRDLTADVIGKTIYEVHPAAKERWGAKYDECLAGHEIRADRVQVGLGDDPAFARVHMAPGATPPAISAA